MLGLAGLMEWVEDRGAVGQFLNWLLLPMASLPILIADAVLRRVGEVKSG